MPTYFGTHRTTLTRDGRGYQWLVAGTPPSPAPPVPPVSQYLFVRQQHYENLQPKLLRGVPIPSAAQLGTIRNWVITRPQEPSHPLPRVVSGVRPELTPATIYQNSIFTRQEMPPHMAPRLTAHNPDDRLGAEWVFAYTVQ